MRKLMKTQQQRAPSLLPVAGILLVAGLLFLAHVKENVQGAGSPASDTTPAHLRIHYEATLGHTTIDVDSQTKESQRQSLDLSAVFQVPNIDYRAKDQNGRPIPFMFRYEHGQLTGPISGAQRMGQSTLTSLSGNATLSWERTYSSKLASQQGSKQGRGEIRAEDGSFSIYILGDKVQVSAHCAPFPVTGQVTDNISGTRPITENTGVSTIVYNPRGDSDPRWTISSSWTGGGWTGAAEFRSNESSARGDSQALYRVNFTLDLSGKEEVEAVIIPVGDYDHWLPQAGFDENTPGNGIAFKVVLQKKGEPGKAPNQKAKSFRFELSDVSHEPGVCLNWPPKERSQTTADLKIDQVANPELKVADDGQSATSVEGLVESSVIIFSYDWGAWGKLKVTVTLEGDSTVVAHLKDKPDVQLVTIPRDDNGNHIADAWEAEEGLSGSPAADSDDDLDPEGDGDAGDGISLYEEYRGFMLSGKHERTSSYFKDLFVFDKNGLGLGKFGVSGLTVHWVYADEYAEESGTNPYVINFNYKTGHRVDEHVLILQDARLETGVLGETQSLGPPKNIVKGAVKVDLVACLGTEWGVEMRDATIAHELAHGCRVNHHGLSEAEEILGEGGDYETGRVQVQRNGAWVDSPWDSGTVAVRGGARSGDQLCIMRYNSASYYEFPGGVLRWKNPDGKWIQGYYYHPDETPGTRFCTSKEGTGVNDPGLPRPLPKAGNATRGECVKQFCVNDEKH